MSIERKAVTHRIALTLWESLWTHLASRGAGSGLPVSRFGFGRVAPLTSVPSLTMLHAFSEILRSASSGPDNPGR